VCKSLLVGVPSCQETHERKLHIQHASYFLVQVSCTEQNTALLHKLSSLYKILHEIASDSDTRNLFKFLVQLFW